MLLNLEQNNHLDRESILFALLFHDCQKYLIDINGKLHFQQNHPLQAATFINECLLQFQICKGDYENLKFVSYRILVILKSIRKIFINQIKYLK
jgi:hypothetical protein